MPAPKGDLLSRRIVEALRKKYCPPAGAFIEQVPDGTGGYKRRTADGLGMLVWPSRGLELHGFEIKVARGDWLKELKDPTKAEAFSLHCDRWYVVTAKVEPEVARL